MEDKRYEEGQTAFKDGQAVSDNPYTRGTEAWADWDSGWCDAEADTDPDD